MNETERIRLIDVGKTYSDGVSAPVHAVSGVTLGIGRGEFAGVCGRSGSGKSTLMHLMSGMSSPTSGQVLLNGRSLERLSANERARVRNREIGFVFQSFHLEHAYTAWENVALPLLVMPMTRQERMRRAHEALEKVDLLGRADHRTNRLSGGEMQRVCIARAIVNDPDILFADEPTGNLDKRNGSRVLEIFRALVADGRTVVMVTHHEADLAYCSRVIQMEDGRVVGDGKHG